LQTADVCRLDSGQDNVTDLKKNKKKLFLVELRKAESLLKVFKT
jgi:hypothetical protein